MIVIHHNDNDGRCSAELVRMVYPAARLIEMDHDGGSLPIDFDSQAYGEELWILDFSFPIERMISLQATAERFIWIDHHASILQAAQAAGFAPEGLQRVGEAGCELTWQYLHGPRHPIPRWVRLIGRHDVWDHRDHDVQPFHYGTGCFDTRPGTNFWQELRDLGCDRIIAMGNVIERYVNAQNEAAARSGAFRAQLDGLSVVGMVASTVGSDRLRGVEQGAEVGMVCGFKGLTRQWKVSLYSLAPGVDVAALAARFGGGGHERAAGFVCHAPPWDVLPGWLWL